MIIFISSLKAAVLPLNELAYLVEHTKQVTEHWQSKGLLQGFQVTEHSFSNWTCK